MSFPRTTHLALLTALAVTGLTSSDNGKDRDLTVELPSFQAHAGSDIVDPDFLGLAFEAATWVRYALDDNGETNAFTANLIDAIYSRTGGTPIIRLGGTTYDYGEYLLDQEEPALPVAEQDKYQNIGGTTIGPSYWDLTKRFPEAKFMVQVPLATSNISKVVAWAKAAVEGIGLDRIHSMQPGNEPDLYRDNFTGEDGQYLGPPGYQGKLNNETYVGNYTKYVAAIYEAIDLPDHFFTAFDVASHTEDHSITTWILNPEECFGLGIDEGNSVKEVSHHYYQNHAGEADDLEEGLMNISITHGNLDYLKPRINWVKENRRDLPFILNEIGNSLDPTNKYQYQARLGSALWAVDFYLYSLSIGIRRFNHQQLMHAGFNLWLPVASAGYEPQVFANYYSQPFLADFVGDSGKTRVSKVNVNNSDNYPNLAVYVALEENEAKRLAFANLDYWNRTSSDHERPVARIAVILDNIESVMVTHLSSPDGAGAGAETITYAGSQWTYESMGKEVKGVRDDTEQVPVEDGYAMIEVPSSEAVIVYL